MKKSQYLTVAESKKPCYIMVGDQIKYEPAFVQKTPDFLSPNNRRKLSKSRKNMDSQKQLLSGLAIDDNLRPFSQAVSPKDADELVKQIKFLKKARRSIVNDKNNFSKTQNVTRALFEDSNNPTLNRKRSKI